MNNELNGVTVDGKSIESYLMDKRDKETIDLINDNKHYIKKKGKVKMEAKHDKNPSKIIDMDEMKTYKAKIIAHLLVGRNLTSAEVSRICEISKSDAASNLRVLYNSKLNPYIDRKGNKSTGYVFSIDPIYGLTIERALELASVKRAKNEVIKKSKTEQEVKKPEIKQTIIEQNQNPLNINLNISGKIEFVFKIERM